MPDSASLKCTSHQARRSVLPANASTTLPHSAATLLGTLSVEKPTVQKTVQKQNKLSQYSAIAMAHTQITTEDFRPTQT